MGSMMDLDYDCDRFADDYQDEKYFSKNPQAERMKKHQKKMQHYAKEIKVTYEVYSSAVDSVNVQPINRIHKNNSVVYQCTRVPLNTFVTTTNDSGQARNHRDSKQKIPFVCVSVQCPKFDPIICDTNCQETSDCVTRVKPWLITCLPMMQVISTLLIKKSRSLPISNS